VAKTNMLVGDRVTQSVDVDQDFGNLGTVESICGDTVYVVWDGHCGTPNPLAYKENLLVRVSGRLTPLFS